MLGENDSGQVLQFTRDEQMQEARDGDEAHEQEVAGAQPLGKVLRKPDARQPAQAPMNELEAVNLGSDLANVVLVLGALWGFCRLVWDTLGFIERVRGRRANPSDSASRP